MKKINFIIFLLFLITVILSVVNIDLSNRVSTNSIYASELSDKISKIKKENLSLKTEILDFTSIEMISSRAASLGFVEEKQYISLNAPYEVAVNNK